MTPRTLPPVELVCSSMQTARDSHRRIAHNALSVALLHPDGRNVPILRAPAQVPNGLRRGDTAGGHEVMLLEQLQASIDHWEERHALALPDSPERHALAARLDRADKMLFKVRSDIADMPAPSIPGGMRDVYTVTVPGLHVRVQGQAYTADLIRVQIAVDPSTPRYEEYLGRYQHTGHQATGPQPLYKVRSDRSGLTLASEARDWHEALVKQLWPAPRLPELLAVPVEVAPA